MVKGFNFLIIVLLRLSCSCLVHRNVCASPLPRPAIFHRHNSTPFAVVAPRFPNLNPSNFHSRLIFILLIPLAFDWPRYLHQATLISSPFSITFSAFSSTLVRSKNFFSPSVSSPLLYGTGFSPLRSSNVCSLINAIIVPRIRYRKSKTIRRSFEDKARHLV